MSNDKKRLLIPGVALGIFILVLAIVLKSAPDVQENADKSRLVEVVPLALVESSPEIIAYGRVEPKHSWQAISEVNGKVIYRHPKLESGRLLTAGTLVLKIDPLEYQLKKTQALANMNMASTQLTRLLQEEKNLQTSLNIEQQKLTLENQEYQRKLELQKKKLISSSEVESQKKSKLVQSKLVQDLSGSLSLIPDDKKVAQSQFEVNQSLYDDALRQLENTEVTLPFDARIAEVNVEQAQAITVGNIMFEAHQLGNVVVKAELSLKDAEVLMASVHRAPANDTYRTKQLPNVEQLGLMAHIELQLGNKAHQWPAKLTRIAESINPDQATIGFYLEVMQNFEHLDLSDKPPLTKGMFVNAKLKGLASQQFIIPEKALHGKQIYIMDNDNKLTIRDINIEFRNNQGVAISGEIHQGEKLVLNDLIPAIPGMSLKTNISKGE